MLNPFSGVPTPYRVEAGGRSWFGNCVWDAFGIRAALGVDGHVSTACPDCGEALEVDVRRRAPERRDDLVAHCPRAGRAAGGTTSSSPEAR